MTLECIQGRNLAVKYVLLVQQSTVLIDNITHLETTPLYLFTFMDYVVGLPFPVSVCLVIILTN